MVIYNHFSYGEALAKGLKAIAHNEYRERFFRATEQEGLYTLYEKISSLDSTVMVAIDGSNSDFMWQPDSMFEKPQYFFIILHPSSSDNADSIHQAQSYCKNIGCQVISRMLQDQMLCIHGLEFLDKESFTMRGVGPLGDNFYGILVGFNLNNSFNFELDNDYWL